MSPPTLTSTPQPLAAAAAAAARSAAHALAVAPRSSLIPAGTRIAKRSRSRVTARQPARTRAVIATCGSGCPPGGSSSRQSRSYPASSRARPTVGSTSPPVSSAARSASANDSIRSRLAFVDRPARALTRESSESARKRLHARSIAASSCSTAARAASSSAGSVRRSTTLVPSASQVAVPSTSWVAVPSASRVAVPSTSQVAVPSTSWVALPSASRVAVPSASWVAVPSAAGVVDGGWGILGATGDHRSRLFGGRGFLGWCSGFGCGRRFLRWS